MLLGDLQPGLVSGHREYCCASMLLGDLQPRLVPALADAGERVTTVQLLARSRNDKCPRPTPALCRSLHISQADSYLITLIYVMLIMVYLDYSQLKRERTKYDIRNREMVQQREGLWFYRPGGGAKDVFVHHSEIQEDGFRSLEENQRVQFEITQGPKGPQAVGVSAV
jgi:cold shock protein